MGAKDKEKISARRYCFDVHESIKTSAVTKNSA